MRKIKDVLRLKYEAKLSHERILVAGDSADAAGALQGPGWTLELAAGWSVAPGARAASYTVTKKRQIDGRDASLITLSEITKS